MFMILQALKFRAEYLQVFQQGSYLPLKAKGKFKDHIIAFARMYENKTIITIASRFFTSLIQPGQYPLGTQIWDDTDIELPLATPSTCIDGITGQIVKTAKTVVIGEALKYFPVALLGCDFKDNNNI